VAHVVSIFFRAAYLVGYKPWDSGVSPPELVAVVEGKDRLPPGKALDLGCGTGTNCIYMAQHGWEVTGVDFVARAIHNARRKAAAAGVSPRLLVGDVTRLDEMAIGTGYGLLLDLGCFHSIPDTRREAYVRGATEVAQTGASMLLFGFERSTKPPRFGSGPRGLTPGEIERRFGSGWELVAREQGRPMFGCDAAWYRLRRA
jgi:cyclopropane fatty-acyl-phospholipid synthase-like methyltransferase